MEAVLRTVTAILGSPSMPRLALKAIRGLEGVKEAEVVLEGPGVPGGSRAVKVAIASGMANVHKLLQAIQEGKVGCSGSWCCCTWHGSTSEVARCMEVGCCRCTGC